MANKKNPRYVQVRKGLLLISMLLFPVVLSYLSPYIIIMAASMGIVSGSAIFFLVLLVTALFFGRLWCGWLCPGGAVQECAFGANDRRVNGKKLDWIKWVIWSLWLGLIVYLFIAAGEAPSVYPFIGTTNGISVLEIHMYVIYYGVLFLLVAPAFLFGRRWMCHTFCWMAPFMIIGRRIANWLNLPGVRLKAESEKCISCGRCTSVCPMSLEVQAMVLNRNTEHAECILCKNCVAICPKDVLRVRVEQLRVKEQAEVQ